MPRTVRIATSPPNVASRLRKRETCDSTAFDFGLLAMRIEAVDNGVSGHYPACPAQQQLEQGEFAARQHGWAVADAHLARAGVERDIADAQHLAYAPAPDGAAPH